MQAKDLKRLTEMADGMGNTGTISLNRADFQALVAEANEAERLRKSGGQKPSGNGGGKQSGGQPSGEKK